MSDSTYPKTLRKGDEAIVVTSASAEVSAKFNGYHEYKEPVAEPDQSAEVSPNLEASATEASATEAKPDQPAKISLNHHASATEAKADALAQTKRFGDQRVMR